MRYCKNQDCGAPLPGLNEGFEKLSAILDRPFEIEVLCDGCQIAADSEDKAELKDVTAALVANRFNASISKYKSLLKADPNRARKKIIDWINEVRVDPISLHRERCVVVTGSAGAGKTYGKVSAARAFIRAGFCSEDVVFSKYLATARQFHDEKKVGHRLEMIKRIQKASIWIVDDLVPSDEGKDKELAVLKYPDWFYEQIDFRFEANLPTWVGMGKKAFKRLEKIHGDSLFRRMMTPGRSRHIELEGTWQGPAS